MISTASKCIFKETPLPTASKAKVSKERITGNRVRENPNEFMGIGQQMPPRAHQPLTKTKCSSEQQNVSKKGTAQGFQLPYKTTLNSDQPNETKKLEPVSGILSSRSNALKSSSLDNTNEIQNENRPGRLPPLRVGHSPDKTNETNVEYAHWHLSSTEITKNVEQTDETNRAIIDQSSETRPKGKKKKKKHNQTRVSPESNPQNYPTENQSMAKTENQEDMVGNH